MSFDWDNQFCLGCDKQTEGSTYCSESCRIADYEKTSPPSPNFSNMSQQKFYLNPVYEFSNANANATTRTLTPSSSHTSLNSLISNSSTKSTSSTTSTKQQQEMAERSAKELRAYARSFESVRLQRRRSY
ncbi:hypothetical protein QBC38DRAFT_474912 [Podospora fimiseda]|uniref:Life-span regulatory factor domain-containing protein n=1 Tax=Podospora fimiseda TaxID=252190 RepID=A0AAN7H193_9PEZI|nr:hypothetical protein QBC38DRAFT_474912 [Podospora fimiseda]